MNGENSFGAETYSSCVLLLLILNLLTIYLPFHNFLKKILQIILSLANFVLENYISGSMGTRDNF